jgi:hypothetical protein
MAKSRNEYLQERLAIAKTINPSVAVTIPTGTISKTKLTELDAALNKVIYPSGVYGATGTPAPTGGTGSTSKTSTTNTQNWLEFMRLTLENWGLPTLASVARDFLNQGFEADTVLLKIQETPEYQQRFTGNVARQKAGLSVLGPKEYLAMEDAYRAVLRSSGMPTGFYDEPQDFANFISKDVSATELKSRVDLASTVVNSADPFLVGQLKDYYNLTKGEMLAYTLDPERAIPLIERQIKAAEFGAAAQRQDITVSAPMAEQFASMGITKTQAEQGFQTVAQVLPGATKLAEIYDKTYGQEQAIAETFGGAGAAQAAEQRRQLAELEKSSFAGQAGVGRGSLARPGQGQI